jgi:hypothetical protein
MAIAFRNRTAAFIWGLAALWLILLAAGTYAFVRDGPPAGYSSPAVIAILVLFWAGGIGLAAFALNRPCFLVSVGAGARVFATWRYPHRVVRKQFDAASVRPAEVVAARDDEDNPYFYARVRTFGTDYFDLAQGSTRSLCEAACEQFNAALFGRKAP